MTVAASDATFASDLAQRLSGMNFRAYTSADMIGVEVGGAIKNVLAIGAGISDGLGFGANTRIALITRGLVEMTRLGVALGARKETFMGLAGLGDLVLTCTDNQSRNRRFGLALASGDDGSGRAEIDRPGRRRRAGARAVRDVAAATVGGDADLRAGVPRRFTRASSPQGCGEGIDEPRAEAGD